MRISNRRIGHYAIKEEIGKGGAAIVYRAIDTRDEKEVALKILLPENVSKATYLYRFVKEGQNATRLSHPNIVRIYEAGEADGFHYIALEYIRGETLSKRLTNHGKPLTAAEAIPLIEQIASGLEYAHNLGFLHRDINLNNILITKKDQALLSDFGMAKQMVSDETTTIFTMADYSIGTPAFMSPEQARGDMEVDQRSDIYGLGVVAYRMFTGRLPYQADSQPALLYKIIYEAAPAPEVINPSIPPGIAYALKRVLSKDPPKRYRSAAAFANALDEGQSWVPQGGRRAYSGAIRTHATTQHPNSVADMNGYTLPTPEPTRTSGWAVLPMLVGLALVAITLVMLLTWENRIRNQLDSIMEARTPSAEGNDGIDIPLEPMVLKPFIAADGAYTINVPEGWRMSSMEDEIQFEEDDYFARIFVKRVDTSESPDALERIAIRYIEEESAFQSTEPISGGFVQLGELSGYEQSVKAVWLSKEVLLRIVAINNNGQNYIVGTAVQEEESQGIKKTFDAVFNSFRARE